MNSLSRRDFIKTTGIVAGGLSWCPPAFAEQRRIAIKDVRLEKGIAIESDDGIIGKCAGSAQQDLKMLERYLPRIRELLVGKNTFDVTLAGETLWDALYPGKAKLFGEGRDPLTGELILNKPRRDRQTATGRVFIAFSTVDIALWDLRGRILKKPAWQIMGPANRERMLMYWRPGEVGTAPSKARAKAREAFDRGYRIQKWYFNKGAKDGERGFKENVELVRVLREELPEAMLMFDNHSIRHSDDVDYSLRLCKAVAPYKPFWIEELICPEHVEGYARIKGETGLPIASGEHWYTHWAVKPFLDRKCVDFVQSDPTWGKTYTPVVENTIGNVQAWWQKDGPKWLYNLQWFEGDVAWDQKVYSHDYIITFDKLPAITPHHAPPLVRLVATVAGPNCTVQLRAEASSRDTGIAKVEFRRIPGPWKNWFLTKPEERAHSEIIGEATATPYVFEWKHAPAGFQNIIARVTDKKDTTAESNVARISVGLTNLALGKTATASSKPETAAKAVDGNLYTAWSGERPGGKRAKKGATAETVKAEPATDQPPQDQWLAIDLGAEQTVGGVAVSWWKAYARDYRIEVSSDGQTWKKVFHESKKSEFCGNTDTISFQPARARHVRLVCTKPGTDWGGYTVYELGVYASLPKPAETFVSGTKK